MEHTPRRRLFQVPPSIFVQPPAPRLIRRGVPPRPDNADDPPGLSVHSATHSIPKARPRRTDRTRHWAIHHRATRLPSVRRRRTRGSGRRRRGTFLARLTGWHGRRIVALRPRTLRRICRRFAGCLGMARGLAAKCAWDVILKEMRDVGLESPSRIIEKVRMRRNGHRHREHQRTDGVMDPAKMRMVPA